MSRVPEYGLKVKYWKYLKDKINGVRSYLEKQGLKTPESQSLLSKSEWSFLQDLKNRWETEPKLLTLDSYQRVLLMRIQRKYAKMVSDIDQIEQAFEKASEWLP